MSNLILKTPELQEVEESRAQQIKLTFDPMVKMLEEFENDYNNVIKEANENITIEVIKKAKRLRLDISQVRIKTGKLKDKQKEYIKLEDKAIIGVHNILVFAVKEKEDKLKEIETYFEEQEKERLIKLQSKRALLLSKYVDDANDRDLVKFEDDEFEALLSMKKQAYLDKKKAEKKAEDDRIKKERERIKKENEALKKEADKIEKQLKIDAAKRAKIEAERIAKESKEKGIREAKEKKEREAYELKLKKEREEKDKVAKENARIQKELNVKKDAENQRLLDIENAKQLELQKGDADKMNDLIESLESLKNKYSFKSNKNINKYISVNTLIDKVVEYIKQ